MTVPTTADHMMAILLAMSCAVIQGLADFCGGRTARAAPAIGVWVLSNVAGLPMDVVELASVGGRWGLECVVWGGLAGSFGMAGLVVLYVGVTGGRVRA